MALGLVGKKSGMTRIFNDEGVSVPVPRRPVWREGQTADELEQNERAAFLEWRRNMAALSAKVCAADERLACHFTPNAAAHLVEEGLVHLQRLLLRVRQQQAQLLRLRLDAALLLEGVARLGERGVALPLDALKVGLARALELLDARLEGLLPLLLARRARGGGINI